MLQKIGSREQRQNQDLTLIAILRRDGRKSLKQLAFEVGVSTITLQRMIKRLIADDVIHVGAVINPEKVGYPIACMVSLEVSNAKLQRVIAHLVRNDAVNTVSKVTGRFNVMAFVRFRGLDELFTFSQEILDTIDGILDHEIDFCISVKKGRYTMLNPNLVDSPNRRLIGLLTTDGRSSNHKLAKILEVSPSTIQRAIRKMFDDGIMKVTAIADPVKINLPIAVTFGLNVVPNRRQRIIRTLTPYTEVEFLAKTTGRFDIMVLARFPTNEALTRFLERSIAAIKGVNNVETMLILEIDYGTMYGGKLRPAVVIPYTSA